MEWIYNLVLITLQLIHLVNGRSHDKMRYNNACENVPINTLKLFNDSEHCGMFVACMGKVAVHYKCFSNSVYDDGTPNCLICDAGNQNSFDTYTTRATRRSNLIEEQTSEKEYEGTKRPKIMHTFNSVENEDKIKLETQTESLFELSNSNEDEDEQFSKDFGITPKIANNYNNKVITKESDIEITNEKAQLNLNNKIDGNRDENFYSRNKISITDDDSDEIFFKTMLDYDEVGEESSIDPNEELIDFSDIDSTTSRFWGSDEYGDLVTNEYVDELSGSKYPITNEYEEFGSFDKGNSTQNDDNGNDNELDNSISFGYSTYANLSKENQNTSHNCNSTDLDHDDSGNNQQAMMNARNFAEHAQDYDKVSIDKHHHISSHKDANSNANSNDHNSLISHHSSAIINDYPPMKVSLPVTSPSKYENDEISYSINENIPNDRENYVNKDGRNLLNTLNGNYYVNEEQSNNSLISSNEEVSNDDDMKMKDTDGSLEFVDDKTSDDFFPQKNSEMKQDTWSLEVKNSMETKSMKDENITEYDKSIQDLAPCYVLNEDKATKSTTPSTTQFPNIYLFHSKSSNGENVESKFDNGLEITNDENSSNKEALLESFTIKSTSFEVENSQFSINESSNNFENSLIRKSEEYKETTKIDEDKATTKNPLESSTQNHEQLFSDFFDSKVTKVFTKMRRVRKSRPITTTPKFLVNADLIN